MPLIKGKSKKVQDQKAKEMRANRCHTYCVQTDYSTNKLIFKPVLKDCKNCEFLKKRMLDKELNELIEKQKTKKCDQR